MLNVTPSVLISSEKFGLYRPDRPVLRPLRSRHRAIPAVDVKHRRDGHVHVFAVNRLAARRAEPDKIDQRVNYKLAMLK